jgi:hypothetical protein
MDRDEARRISVPSHSGANGISIPGSPPFTWIREGEAGEAPAVLLNRKVRSEFAARQEPRRLALPVTRDFDGGPRFARQSAIAVSPVAERAPAFRFGYVGTLASSATGNVIPAARPIACHGFGICNRECVPVLGRICSCTAAAPFRRQHRHKSCRSGQFSFSVRQRVLSVLPPF